MGEYFKSWRQRIGCVMLVIACVFTSLWIRSLENSDALVVSVGKYKNEWNDGRKLYVDYGTTLYIVKSEMCSLLLSRKSFQSPDEQTIEEVKARHKYPVWESAANTIVDPMITDAEWQFWGFGFCTDLSEGEAFEHHLLMSYWSIVIPLTVISAWLLLSKPHKATQKRDIEPDPNEGTWIIGEFFKTIRRKIGMVTLLMTCVALAGWVRSESDTDIITFPTVPSFSGSASRILISWKRGLLWTQSGSGVDSRGHLLPRWKTIKPSNSFSEPLTLQLILNELLDSPNIQWKVRWNGVGFGERIDVPGTPRIWLVLIPYWSIVIPLTALSAFLLLSKPRNMTQERTDKPVVQNEGGGVTT